TGGDLRGHRVARRLHDLQPHGVPLRLPRRGGAAGAGARPSWCPGRAQARSPYPARDPRGLRGATMARTPSAREQAVVLCLVVASAQVTWGAIVPVLPLYLERYGLAVGALGPILAAFAVGRAVANAPAGYALRWFAPRRYLWVTSAGLMVVTALTGFATTTPTIVGMRLLAGIFGGAVVTIAFSVLVTAAPEGRRG